MTSDQVLKKEPLELKKKIQLPSTEVKTVCVDVTLICSTNQDSICISLQNNSPDYTLETFHEWLEEHDKVPKVLTWPSSSPKPKQMCQKCTSVTMSVSQQSIVNDLILI